MWNNWDLGNLYMILVEYIIGVMYSDIYNNKTHFVLPETQQGSLYKC